MLIVYAVVYFTLIKFERCTLFCATFELGNRYQRQAPELGSGC